MRYAKAAAFAYALLLSACGGGGGSGGGDSGLTLATNLAGTWSGQFEDSTGTMNTLQLTVDANGKATNITVSGIVVQDSPGVNQTANIFVAGTNLYSFVASDGTRAGLFTDASATHATIVDQFGEVGVLQKGATFPLPAFAGADAAGSWTGYNVDLDANVNVTRTFNSSATVTNAANFPFTGTDSVAGAFSGTLPTVDTTFGRWSGTFAQGAVSGEVHAFMSSDKTFAGTWTCPNSAVSFTDCSFSVWHK